MFCNLQEHSAGILDVLLDLHQELDGFSAIEKTMVIGESQVHHGPNDDLAIDSDGPFLGSV